MGTDRESEVVNLNYVFRRHVATRGFFRKLWSHAEHALVSRSHGLHGFGTGKLAPDLPGEAARFIWSLGSAEHCHLGFLGLL